MRSFVRQSVARRCNRAGNTLDLHIICHSVMCGAPWAPRGSAVICSELSGGRRIIADPFWLVDKLLDERTAGH